MNVLKVISFFFALPDSFKNQCALERKATKPDERKTIERNSIN